MATPPKPDDGWLPVAPSGNTGTGDWGAVPAAEGEVGQGGVLGNVGKDDPWGGVKNIGTFISKWPSQIPGIFGDVREIGDLLASGAQSAIGRKLDRKNFMEKETRSAEQIRKDWKKEQDEKYTAIDKGESKPGLLDRTLNLFELHGAPTAQEIHEAPWNPIGKQALGEYKPQSIQGRLLGAFGEAANPLFGVGAKWKAGERLLAPATKAIPRAIERTTQLANAPGTRRTVMQGLGGIGSEAGSELSGGNPYWALAGGFALPSAAEAAAGARRAIIKPQTREGQARAAAQQMGKDITEGTLREKGDPSTLVKRVYDRGVAALDNLPGWLKGNKDAAPTIAELTGNRALALSESAAGMTDPKRAAQLGERSDARTAAQQETLSGLKDPGATGMEVKEGILDQLAQLDQRMDDAAPRGGTIERHGANIREPLTEARTAVTMWRDKIYEYLRANFGDHQLSLPALKQTAENLMQHKPGAERPKMSDPSIELARGMPDAPGTVTFDFLHTYLKDLNTALAEARAARNVTQEGRLKALKKAVWDDMNNAADNRIKQMGQQDQAGQGPGTGHNQGPNLAPEDWGQGMAADKEKWLAEREGGDKAASNVPGELFGQRGAEILKAASAAHAYLGDTFRKNTVGDLLARDEHNAAWNVKDAAVPREAFPGGDTGHAITRGVMKAAGDSPAIVQAMKDTAIMTFRKAADAAGGRMNPKQLQKWKTDYGQSLRAIDDVEVAHGRPKFSEGFDNLANAQSRLAADFINADEPVAATRKLGTYLADPTGNKVQKLIQDAGGSPAVMEGLKTLAIDHMFNTATSTAGKNFGLNISNMIQRYEPSLLKLFEPEHMQLIKSLAEDSMNQQRLAARKKSIEGGSETAPRLELVKKRMTDMKPRPLLEAMGVPGTLAGVGSGMYWAAQSPVAAFSAATAAAAGYMMNRLRARGVNGINDAYRIGMVDPEVGMRMLKHASENIGDPAWWSRVGEAILRSPLVAQPHLDDADKERNKAKTKRAAGGRVGIDCESCASKLCRDADTIRRKHGGVTKKFLHVSDNAVADALRVAGGRLH